MRKRDIRKMMKQTTTWASQAVLLWLEVLLAERFGHNFRLNSANGVTILSLSGSKHFIHIPQFVDFQKNHSNFACSHWKIDSQEYWTSVLKETSIPAPAIQTLPIPLIEPSEHGYTIHYDILGLTYWMLTRQEEIGRSDLDNHGRFPATASHAYKHGYLERPIVDEWLHILGQVIKRIWPNIKLKQHQFSMKVSHDVDKPSRYGFCTPKQLIRIISGDIIKRRDFKSALFAPWIRFNTHQTLHPSDPYNTFEWIMDVSEQYNLQSAFYFICGGNALQDADYELEHPAIRALIRRIHERGHEIGVHPSYNTYQNPRRIVEEVNRLRKVCTEEGIEQQTWGGRMHYLRWEFPTTLQAWEKAGMDYDSTLGYADHVGFRCGTCFEYPAFDPLKQEMLALRIRPLITMECTVLAKNYMNLGYSAKALEKFISLKEACCSVSGTYTFLWHNSHFISSEDKGLYQKILN